MKLLNEEQGASLKQITSELRHSREAKSISIEDVANKTLIRPAFLQAIESGKFEDLPEPVYVQGFIRRYADAIGLDGVAIAQAFANIAIPPEPLPEIHAPQPQPSINVSGLAPYVVFVFLLAVAGFGLVNLLNSQTGAKSANETKVTVSKAQTKPAPVASTPTPTTPKKVPLEKVRVTIDLQGESWMRIITDGTKVYEGTLNKGYKKTFTAKEGVVIRAGNAGAVLISVNNQPFKVFGEAGSIKQLTYTTESVTSDQ